MTAEQIRRKSNAGELQKSERLSQEFANITLRSAGWNQVEFPDAEVVNIAMALIAAGVRIEGLEKQRRHPPSLKDSSEEFYFRRCSREART